jgi:aminopeptidase-like protein
LKGCKDAELVGIDPQANPRPSAQSMMTGGGLHQFASRLYPICRSITGQGVRQTLALIGEHIPLAIREVPSGTTVYDWEVPLEWNIEDAAVLDPDGERIVDFQMHNLHVVGYSEPVAQTVSLSELEPQLHSLPDSPGWIPYRTSYYRRTWGFCLAHETRQTMRSGRYRVEIKSSLAPGSLSYGEIAIPGRSREEVLFFTHVCHPSLANDNTSGMAIATALAGWIAGESRRYSYRFVFAPGTIGSLCWLRQNERSLARVRAGLVLGLLGDPGALTYKMSRDANTETDAIAGYVLSQIDQKSTVIPFSPYGYDERQLCSPGFNLPVGRLTRSVNGGYPQYHSSGDDLGLIRPECLEQSLEACKLFVTVLEQDARYVNRSPKGEPRLGKRGLYGSVGGMSPAEREHAMLWVLNQSDGSKSLLDIARRSGLSFEVIQEASVALEQAGLLRPKGKQARIRSSPRNSGAGKTKTVNGRSDGYRRRATSRRKGDKR